MYLSFYSAILVQSFYNMQVSLCILCCHPFNADLKHELNMQLSLFNADLKHELNMQLSLCISIFLLCLPAHLKCWPQTWTEHFNLPYL